MKLHLKAQCVLTHCLNVCLQLLVDDLNFSVPAGSVVGIIGGNGAGVCVCVPSQHHELIRVLVSSTLLCECDFQVKALQLSSASPILLVSQPYCRSLYALLQFAGNSDSD